MSRPFDCGVIDEIQFLGDDQRGPAWTRAFLGLRVSNKILHSNTKDDDDEDDDHHHHRDAVAAVGALLLLFIGLIF